jgi:hypothetical protein
MYKIQLPFKAAPLIERFRFVEQGFNSVFSSNGPGLLKKYISWLKSNTKGWGSGAGIL